MNYNGKTRIKRTLTALLLMFVLSFSTVLAENENNQAVSDGQTQAQVTSASEGTLVWKRSNLYYRKPNGKIRKKSGFVTIEGKRYYIKTGGKIVRKKTYKVKGKYYRSGSSGIVKTGVYRWGGKYYYSDPTTGQLKKTKGFVTWKKKLYYVQKGGVILTNGPYSINDLPYVADEKGRLTKIAVPSGDGNPVIKVAKEEVGIKTGVKYWWWYFKMKFIDTDRTPWCGAFVAWCYNEAGMYDKVSECKNMGYVPTISKYATKHDLWIKRTKAKGGDIIIFGSNQHVGLVEGISGDYIITIEGNAGPTAAYGSKKPGAVVRNIYKIDSTRIKGVIRVK